MKGCWDSACHVCRMVLVFREVRRVLRDDGTLWLNYGDTYSGSGKGQNADGTHNHKAGDKQHTNKGATTGGICGEKYKGLPGGNLIGVPWRVALALQADGWILRSDIPWVKRSAMPESVRNRPAKALEYVFMLVKRMGYFYDQEAVKKAGAEPDRQRSERIGGKNGASVRHGEQGMMEGATVARNFRNADLWFESVDAPHGLCGVGEDLVGLDVTSSGYPGAHFATFGAKLIEPMVKAGTSEHGCCADCGSPWVRVTEEIGKVRIREGSDTSAADAVEVATGRHGDSSIFKTGEKTLIETIGWRPSCECHGKLVKVKRTAPKSAARVPGGDRNQPGDAGASPREEGEKLETVVEYVSDLPLDEHSVKPCTVLDIFMGSGTTAAVSIQLGRHAVGIELSEDYLLRHQVKRVKEALLSVPHGDRLLPEEPKKVQTWKPKAVTR